MCSIHKSAVLFAAACLGLPLLAACTLQSRATPAPVNTEAIAPDAAMQLRNWPQVPAYYASGAVIAGSTRFFLEPSPEAHPRLQQAADLPLFIANTFFEPFTYFIVAPFEPVVYRGMVVPPTYNANPPLPPISSAVVHP